MINLCYDAHKGHFYIESNAGKIELDEYVELIFESALPFRTVVHSEEHQIFTGYYRVKIHQSLIHCGEDEPALFATCSKKVMSEIRPGLMKLRLKKYQHSDKVWYLPKATTYAKSNA